MELAFETRALRDLCESEQKAKKALGAEVASKLIRRLADLRATRTNDEMPFGRPRKFGDKLFLTLSATFKLVVTANHINNPTYPSGAVNWSKVTRIKLARIGGDDERE